MRSLAALTTLTTTLTLCPTFAQILPIHHSPSLADTSPPKTNVTYHQGMASSNETSPDSTGKCDGMSVSSGNLTSGYCVGLQTYALSIERLQGVECAFRLFRGSAACGDDAAEMYNIPIPSGEGAVCVVTRVGDGGRFIKGSGFWVCG